MNKNLKKTKILSLKGYAYIDHANITIAWNIARGSFCTIDKIPDYHPNMISTFFAGRLSNESKNVYWSERAIEKIRVELFPHCISRFLGFFMFSDHDISSLEAFKQSSFFGENHFSEEYFSKIQVQITDDKKSRHDFNWIELIINKDGTLSNNWEEYSKQYWSGQPAPNKPPIWETIINGHIKILNKKIIQEAMLNISSVWPNSFFIFQYGLLASTHNEPNCEGLIVPIITGNDNICNINYYIRIEKIRDKPFLESTDKRIIDIYLKEYSHTFNLAPSEIFQTPDLRGFEIKLTT